jgi:hypothetical protein
MTLEMYQGSIKNAINVEELEKLNNDIIGDQGIPGVFKSQLMTSIRTRINSLLGEATKVEIPF